VDNNKQYVHEDYTDIYRRKAFNSGVQGLIRNLGDEWMNIKPTGKKIKETGVNTDWVSNGKNSENGGSTNMLKSFLKIDAVGIKPSF
jgi:hypothetical protein